jgi:hypothetical protein
MIGLLGVGAAYRAQHQDAIANGLGELLDTVKKFWMSVDWRAPKLLRSPDQILAHQGQRAIDTLIVPDPPITALSRGLEVAYVNNLTHLQLALSVNCLLGHTCIQSI